LPYAAPGVLGFTLDVAILPSRILWPVQREAIADQPLAKVNITDRACRHRSPVLVQRDRDAAYGALVDKGI
jgi:hypothetical protein